MPTTPTPSPRSRPAVFLDRDGTLVEEVPYLHDPAGLALLPGVAAAALQALRAAGYALVVATNQAGVARGYYDEAALARVHRRRRHRHDPAVRDHRARGRPPAAGRGGGLPEPGGGGRRRPGGTERARPASAVTGRAWPGCRLVTERPAPWPAPPAVRTGRPPKHRSNRCCLVLRPVPGGLLLDLRRELLEGLPTR